MRQVTEGELESLLFQPQYFVENTVLESGAAVRDAVEISHQYVGPKEAVSLYQI